MNFGQIQDPNATVTVSFESDYWQCHKDYRRKARVLTIRGQSERLLSQMQFSSSEFVLDTVVMTL